VPLVGDLPVVGTLFSKKANSATEQELVVVVTPELTHPLDNRETPPLPGSDVFEPTDCEFYLLNRLESRRSQDYRSPVRTDAHRIHQFEKCCQDRYIIGPVGYSHSCHQPGDEPATARVQPLDDVPATVTPRP
jgi:pilus assembly protein CpaC